MYITYQLGINIRIQSIGEIFKRFIFTALNIMKLTRILQLYKFISTYKNGINIFNFFMYRVAKTIMCKFCATARNGWYFLLNCA